MKILLHSPVSTVRRNGNRQTSSKWFSILREAGHEITSISHYEGEAADLLLALHANKSREALLEFHEQNPGAGILLALTGTDIYPEPNEEAIDSMRVADTLITLQRNARERVPAEFQGKVTSVIQSASVIAPPAKGDPEHFDVCVVGHLRDVKDPLLTARASRLLPASSKIRILHVGGILGPAYASRVAREEKSNPRYHWLGELSEKETAEVMASSSLLSMTSWSEGGARVVGEAIVHGTPVVSTRIDGVTGLLGDDYPGLFPVGDERSLADLLSKCEEDPAFHEQLSSAARSFAPQFSPESEKEALLAAVKRTVSNLTRETPS